MTTLTATMPAGTYARLLDHYGPSVRNWLRRAENSIADTAARSNIVIDGFYDAGWASAIAIGHYANGQSVVLKAFPDPDRYQHEQAALKHWSGHGVCRLLDTDNLNRILLIELIGNQAGGAVQPFDAVEQVATALPILHQTTVDISVCVPELTSYYHKTVLPRIERRAARFKTVIPKHIVRQTVDLAVALCALPSRSTMLHADLYAENVVFDSHGAPIFIDPHPKVGAPAFDWAFWCVYYQRDTGFDSRVALCRTHTPSLFEEIMAWALTLVVDGTLYYTETNDANAIALKSLLSSPEIANVRL